VPPAAGCLFGPTQTRPVGAVFKAAAPQPLPWVNGVAPLVLTTADKETLPAEDCIDKRPYLHMFGDIVYSS